MSATESIEHRDVRGVIQRYRQFLPVADPTPVISLNEGSTPLIPAPRLARAVHPHLTLYLKFEGVNPIRLDGQKTAAFEIIDELGFVPDFHALPVGNAGNITAYWKGFKEYMQAGKTDRLPRMLGFQAEGANPIVRGKPVANPETVA